MVNLFHCWKHSRLDLIKNKKQELTLVIKIAESKVNKKDKWDGKFTIITWTKYLNKSVDHIKETRLWNLQ